MDALNSLSRVVQIMLRLLDGEELSVQELVSTYGKHAETIKKDIATIRGELLHKPVEIRYSRSERSYRLVGLGEGSADNKFASALVLLMTMYGCRGLSEEEVKQAEGFIVVGFSPQVQQRLKKFAGSFRYHYKPILKKPIFGLVETIFECIVRQQTLRIRYVNILKETQSFDVHPFTLIFNEGYYYMIAEPKDARRVEGNIFRIDQIERYEALSEPFTVVQSGSDFFKPGEFANNSFYMHYGETLTVIRLRMRPYIESYFLAKFPVHEWIAGDEEWLTYECTVAHAESALFWIFSERQWVEVLSPQWLRDKVRDTLAEMIEMYRD